MKRPIVLFVCLCIATEMYAADPINAFTNSYEDISSALTKEIVSLTVRDSALKSELEVCLTRKFTPAPVNENELNQFIEIRTSLDALVQDSSVIKKYINQFEDYQYAKAYRAIFAMLNVLSDLYSESKTDRLYDYLEGISEDKDILSVHKDIFLSLKENIAYYRATMFEFGYLIKYVDQNRNTIRYFDDLDDVKKKLLEGYPFLKKMMQKYISGDITDREKRKLKDSCPEAFPMF